MRRNCPSGFGARGRGIAFDRMAFYCVHHTNTDRTWKRLFERANVPVYFARGAVRPIQRVGRFMLCSAVLPRISRPGASLKIFR